MGAQDMRSVRAVLAATPLRLTLGDRLEAVAGKSSGFDYLRIGLALAIAFAHIPSVTYGATSHEGWLYAFLDRTHLWTAVYGVLPMFFALSGFLVAGSLERCRTLGAFLGLRMLRIVPALAVEIMLSALVLGPLLTTRPLVEYFSDPLFWKYFLNLVGEIQYVLPGIFADNPFPHLVNAQLWTIPYELLCYLGLAALALLGVKRWRTLGPAVTLVTLAAYAVHHGMHRGWAPPLFDMPGLQRGLLLVWSFLWGATLYLYRDRVPWSGTLSVGCAIVAALALKLGGHCAYLVPPSLAYVTVYLGLTNARRAWFLQGADYSYGLFLYHWVIMQTVMTLAPREEFITLFVGIPLALCVAALSWHFVERPCLELRGPLLQADAGHGSRVPILLSTASALGFLAVAVAYEIWSRLAI
jgi:peptidoglycan/LPS O-acetylase OafA/YrhL